MSKNFHDHFKTIDGISVKWLDFAPYAITEDGQVFSQYKWRWLKPNKNKLGYMKVFIRDYEGIAKIQSVHRLVAKLYVPNPENKPDVDHIDNNRSNNYYKNLQWVTHKENIQFSYTRDNRQVPKGEKHWLYGKKQSKEAKAKMSAAKLGEKHPKFKGWYVYEGKKYSSLQELADVMGTYPMKIRRLLKKGLIKFEAK